MPDKTNTILTERFLEFCDFAEEGFEWYGITVTLSDIAKGIADGLDVRIDRYNEKHKSKQWHIGRIMYFVEDPRRITPIDVSVLYAYNGMFPTPTIIDGWHRFAAILYLGLPKFKIIYNGRIDVLRYLEGKRKTKPE